MRQEVAFPQEAGEELIVKCPVRDLGQFQVSEKEPQGLPGGRVGKLLLQGGPQMGGRRFPNQVQIGSLYWVG